MRWRVNELTSRFDYRRFAKIAVAKRRILDRNSPRAKLSYSEAAWLFARIRERAPKLNDRYIMVSNDYIWDREEALLLPAAMGVKTTNNKKTKERLYG